MNFKYWDGNAVFCWSKHLWIFICTMTLIRFLWLADSISHLHRCNLLVKIGYKQEHKVSYRMLIAITHCRRDPRIIKDCIEVLQVLNFRVWQEVYQKAEKLLANVEENLQNLSIFVFTLFSVCIIIIAFGKESCQIMSLTFFVSSIFSTWKKNKRDHSYSALGSDQDCKGKE